MAQFRRIYSSIGIFSNLHKLNYFVDQFELNLTRNKSLKMIMIFEKQSEIYTL